MGIPPVIPLQGPEFKPTHYHTSLKCRSLARYRWDAQSGKCLKVRGTFSSPDGTIKVMVRLKVSLIFESGARIGPGKIALLESVRDTGSISAAARAMGMDYKRAWMLIDSLNRAFDTPVVERAAGGSGGGGATLTKLGADVLARYRRLEAAAAKLAATDLRALEHHALPDAGPKV
jgi:molybdate transport system regulatory protein